MPISGKEMLKLFLREGWVVMRQKGSHVQIAKGLEMKLRKRIGRSS